MDTKIGSFSKEMEKISSSRVPAALLLGSVGGALGASKGFQGATAGQHRDDERLKRGFISKAEWKKRRNTRMAKGIGATTFGMTAGALLPSQANKLKTWLIQAAKESADPIGKRLEQAGSTITSNARKELSNALRVDSEALVNSAVKKSRELGRNFAKGLHDTSVGEGSTPVIQIKLQGGLGGLLGK